MKILITGGGGYIGSYIINNLPKKYDIICLDHGKKYSQFNKSVKNKSQNQTKNNCRNTYNHLCKHSQIQNM